MSAAPNDSAGPRRGIEQRWVLDEIRAFGFTVAGGRADLSERTAPVVAAWKMAEESAPPSWYDVRIRRETSISPDGKLLSYSERRFPSGFYFAVNYTPLQEKVAAESEAKLFAIRARERVRGLPEWMVGCGALTATGAAFAVGGAAFGRALPRSFSVACAAGFATSCVGAGLFLSSAF